MKNNYLVLILMVLISGGDIAYSQNLKALDHSVYDNWKDIKTSIISNDGQWVAHEIAPQLGDGKVFIYDGKGEITDSIFRASRPRFMPGSNALIYRIKPAYDSVRKLKIKGTKKDKLPKDSLGVYNLETREEIRFAGLKSFKAPKDSGYWLMALLENQKKKEDKKENKDSGKKSKSSKEIGNLLLLNTSNFDSLSYKNVSQYNVSDNGQLLVYVQQFSDSLDSIRVGSFQVKKSLQREITAMPGFSKNIAVDKKGMQLAFTQTTDTNKNKAFGLIYYNYEKAFLTNVSGNDLQHLKEGWSVSEHANIGFHDEGTELYFGTAPKPYNKPKDTLTADEKVSVDIWNWKDPLLQTEQLKRLDREKKRAYSAVYFPKEDKMIQLADEEVESIRLLKHAKGKYALANTHKPYRKLTSWNGSYYRDYYLIDRTTGNRKKILEAAASSISLSPNQKYIAWYNIADSSWNMITTSTGNSIKITSGLPVPVFNERNDVPNEAGPYGMAGWTKNEHIVIYDKYDLWLIDPEKANEAVNLTQDMGRSQNRRFRYVKLDPDLQYLPEQMLLRSFNLKTKDAGFYNMEFKGDQASLAVLVEGPYKYGTPKKAKKAEQLLWSKESFQLFPDFYLSDRSFNSLIKVTDANPQQQSYTWGSVELVDWVSFKGDSMQGLLYKPHNYDPDKSYPMLVYFYERYADRLHAHHKPKPIRSVINFSYYTSNDYFIFVPDIIYTEGHPGPNALDCVLSGTQSICERYPFIDRNRLGIQGQSWGGYQTAYIITQTNMFKAAMAGAPVSNMTSAYGGIRWGSGKSRAFQYEETQSRIGGTLWEKLPLYLENSPLFYVDRIETPLLIMHNDKDGAVPWYQGIELFNAMRRLNKPVWMLVYNGAPHNLKRRADMNDLTKRMQQYFDHHLKGAPEPLWLSEGVPAIMKGRITGFETE